MFAKCIYLPGTTTTNFKPGKLKKTQKNMYFNFKGSAGLVTEASLNYPEK
jgi:hypothetical protein